MCDSRNSYEKRGMHSDILAFEGEGGTMAINAELRNFDDGLITKSNSRRERNFLAYRIYTMWAAFLFMVIYTE